MLRTVGPCHRDRKQKRNERREEREREAQQAGRGEEGGEALQVTPLWQGRHSRRV